MKAILNLFALMLAVVVCSANAGESAATRTLLQRHLSAFLDNDLEAVLSDYTDESVLVTADATYTGRQAIRGFFAKLIPLFPKEKSRLDLDRMVVDGGVAFIVWHATTPAVTVTLGTDTFVLKDGKIHRQTFVGQMREQTPELTKMKTHPQGAPLAATHRLYRARPQAAAHLQPGCACRRPGLRLRHRPLSPEVGDHRW